MKNLKLSKNEILNKKELQFVFGGLVRDACRITTVNNGVTSRETIMTNGLDPSGEANSYCVGLIENGAADRCFYDCFYDGFGQ